MSEFLTFMGPSAAACFLLAVIYTYFGCHVLKREIIFIDLSLAQLAALGTTTAFALDLELDASGSFALSLLFVVAGSVFFSTTRNLGKSIPQEAVIGIVYVVSASVALLLASGMPHGAEHLKTLLNGSILWITWGGVLQIFGVTLGVGGLHWAMRAQFFKLSETYKNADAANSLSKTWDFLFYVTLGLVIVFSVRTAGVFLIFTFLIIPAVCGALFSPSMVRQFITGSILGIVVSLAGLLLSFFLDLPTGATLVCSFGTVFFASLVLRRFRPSI
ncbi:MAG: ABC transporter [Nitrospinaceae bacterium]|nr:MAG: ABC transporter [Nitrospinaceae bacterium]